ncbi:phage antirepressor N-terminal domain-containing protein [Pantoea sp. 1.19]|uniref:phage antirepressor N-terminal domain-containing protein n=1 Tax=Pantoea sp. 1.19 TaxID=1925589 RepID=UPI000948D977|nr:phage antirepressor N-terminal domain-containing protein [Pantoea sp. 1.19]
MTPDAAAIKIVFRQHTLTVIPHRGDVYVPMRQIVDSLGMTWPPQRQKLMRQRDKFGTVALAALAPGGGERQRRSLCIPLRKLNGWLFSLNPQRLRPGLRPTVRLWQEECFQVLSGYFPRYCAGDAPPHCDEESAYYVAIATEHFTEILQAWQENIAPALQRLNSPLVGQLHDRFSETSALLCKVDQRLRHRGAG